MLEPCGMPESPCVCRSELTGACSQHLSLMTEEQGRQHHQPDEFHQLH